jgi:hypothetical protein
LSFHPRILLPRSLVQWDRSVEALPRVTARRRRRPLSDGDLRPRSGGASPGHAPTEAYKVGRSFLAGKPADWVAAGHVTCNIQRHCGCNRRVDDLQGMRRSSFGEYRAQLARHEGACGTVFAGMEGLTIDNVQSLLDHYQPSGYQCALSRQLPLPTVKTCMLAAWHRSYQSLRSRGSSWPRA